MKSGKRNGGSHVPIKVKVGVKFHGFQGLPRYARKVSGRIWPCGDFSLGPVPSRPESDSSDEEVTYYSDADIAAGVGPFQGQGPLDLSNVPKSHKHPSRTSVRGLKGITSNGRKMVKSAGAIIKRRYPRHRVTFCTLTLPTMSQVVRRELVQLWPEFARQLLQFLVRRLESQSLPKVVLSVTEIQPGRLAASGEACLHLHLVWLNVPARRGRWAIRPGDVRGWVESFLFRRLPGFDGGFVNVDVRPVRASIAGYMSKYMSKGSECLSEALQDWGADNCVKQWWNMTKDLRDAIKVEMLQGEDVGNLLESVVNWALENGVNDVFHWLRHVDLDLDGVMVTVGWRGWLKEEVRRDLCDILRAC